ncbi:hypothetical protein P0082_03935 [Candidatus Haliotispira prima]|uniref:Uncharacterized protein n=1 Tax=Candidatus Haliotispira prima TaxID=3034016 RepID=A0ABY8MJ32_9SPIO|nr:hypothetical protein P0082_03935 [Candidatus Haliotispira prima]
MTADSPATPPYTVSFTTTGKHTGKTKSDYTWLVTDDIAIYAHRQTKQTADRAAPEALIVGLGVVFFGFLPR